MQSTQSRMGFIRWTLVQVLLVIMFFKMLATQLYLKITKFTRRGSGPKDCFAKILKAYGFVRDISRYNLEVLRRSKRCLDDLAAREVREVSVYGERHVVEVLSKLALDSPVKIKSIYADTGSYGYRSKVASLEDSRKSHERVIIASLVDVERKRERLRKAGVEEQRILVLV